MRGLPLIPDRTFFPSGGFTNSEDSDSDDTDMDDGGYGGTASSSFIVVGEEDLPKLTDDIFESDDSGSEFEVDELESSEDEGSGQPKKSIFVELESVISITSSLSLESHIPRHPTPLTSATTSAPPTTCSPATDVPATTRPVAASNRVKISTRRPTDTPPPPGSLYTFFQTITREEAEARRLATKAEREQEAREVHEMVKRQEALKAITKAERKRFLNRERQRRRRERKRAAKVRSVSQNLTYSS